MTTAAQPSNTSFIGETGRLINAGLARTVVLGGNIQDLFPLENSYASLIDLLSSKFKVNGKVLVVYELNGPIRFVNPDDFDKFKKAWVKWQTGKDVTDLIIERTASISESDKQKINELLNQFETDLAGAQANPALGLELLRQMCICSRETMRENLLIVIERADMLIPMGEISRLSDSDRRRVAICHDWFSDTSFLHGNDSVILIAESRSLLSGEISKLPQIMQVEVRSPSYEDRLNYINWYETSLPPNENGDKKIIKLWSTKEALAIYTAGLSLHALRQLLANACYDDSELKPEAVSRKVEEYIKSQVGDDVIEFARPNHYLKDLIGFSKLKKFLADEIIPRLRATDDSALVGMAVCGSIGCGKTFVMEAVAAELGDPILILKNLRSKWFGETDVIIERLYRVIEALMKVDIFVDEADTQFGGLSSDTHETERRLTGKIQAMMSDSKLRGKVSWILMTARINLLSPDIRRPGRAGELIIPIFDPESPEDIDEFINWTVKAVCTTELIDQAMDDFRILMRGYSAASYASLRSELIAKAQKFDGQLNLDQVKAIVNDLMPAQIGQARRYQMLQALVNCTRRSLMPNPNFTDEDRESWEAELRLLESQGVGTR